MLMSCHGDCYRSCANTIAPLLACLCNKCRICPLFFLFLFRLLIIFHLNILFNNFQAHNSYSVIYHVNFINKSFFPKPHRATNHSQHERNECLPVRHRQTHPSEVLRALMRLSYRRPSLSHPRLKRAIRCSVRNVAHKTLHKG